MTSWIWLSVGSPAMVVTLSICQCTVIHKICQLEFSVRGYLMKPAQDCPQMRKKPLQKWFVHCNRYCKITTRISIFARFFYGCQGQRSHDVVQLFFTLSIDPSSHNYPPNTCYQDYKALFSFFKFWEKWSFFSLYQTRFDVAAKEPWLGMPCRDSIPYRSKIEVSLAKNKQNSMKN